MKSFALYDVPRRREVTSYYLNNDWNFNQSGVPAPYFIWQEYDYLNTQVKDNIWLLIAQKLGSGMMVSVEAEIM